MAFLPCLIILISFAVSSQGAIANDQTDNKNQVDRHLGDLFELPLEELIKLKVTAAALFPETQLNASSTVSVISRKDWLRRGDRRFSDLFQHLPATIALPYLAGESISIRGYASNSSNRGTTGILDNTPLNTLSIGTSQHDKANISLGVLDRVEVVRGASSALYGSDAFHGAVVMNSYQSDVDEMDIGGSYADNNYYQGHMRYSAEVSSQHRFHFAVGTNGQSDQGINYRYIHPVSGFEELGDLENRDNGYTVLAKLSNQNEPDYSYRLTLLNSEQKSRDYQGLGRFFFQGKSALLDRDLVSKNTDFQMISSQFLWHYGENTNIGFNTYLTKSRLEFLVNLTSEQQTTRDTEVRDGVMITLTHNSERLNSNFSAIVGYDQIVINNSDVFKVGLNGDITKPRMADAADGTSRHTGSIVLQAKTRLWDDKIELLYGARLDDFSDLGSEVTPRAGIIYLPTTQRAIKLLYGQAFRPPTSNEVHGVGIAQGGPGLKPEILNTYEFIFMQQTASWRTELVLFTSEWHDGIILEPCEANSRCALSGFSSQYVNRNRHSSKGLEVSVEGAVDNWFYKASASYVKSRDETLSIDYKAFPRYIANWDIGYHFSQWNIDVYLSNRMFDSATQGPPIQRINHPEPLPFYWRSDLHVSMPLDRGVAVFFNVRNILDRENYFPSIGNSDNGIEDENMSVQLGISWRH